MDDVMMECLVSVTLDVFGETGGLGCIMEMLMVQLRSLLLFGVMSDVNLRLAERIMDETKIGIDGEFADDVMVRCLDVHDDEEMKLFGFVVRYVDRMSPCMVEISRLSGVGWGLERVRKVFGILKDGVSRSENMRKLVYLCVWYFSTMALYRHPAHDCDDGAKVVRLIRPFVNAYLFSDLSVECMCPKVLDVILDMDKIDDVNFDKFVCSDSVMSNDKIVDVCNKKRKRV
jgi:hypothetical protein